MEISKMRYRDMLGFPKKPKKRVEKKVAPKPSVSPDAMDFPKARKGNLPTFKS